MKTRCNNPNHQFYHRYGGRGIKVCDEWNIFINFKNWAINNGYNDTLSIDRIDNDKGYYPENCRWIPMNEQAKNKENSKKVQIGSRTFSVTDFMNIYNLPYHKAYALHNKFSGKTGHKQIVGLHKQVIKEAFEAGYLVEDIARYYKKTTKHISSVLLEMGIYQGRAKGFRSGMSKLKEEDVIKMRQLRKDGATLKTLSKMFNTTDSNVEVIVNNKTWKHIL